MGLKVNETRTYCLSYCNNVYIPFTRYYNKTDNKYESQLSPSVPFTRYYNKTDNKYESQHSPSVPFTRYYNKTDNKYESQHSPSVWRWMRLVLIVCLIVITCKWDWRWMRLVLIVWLIVITCKWDWRWMRLVLLILEFLWLNLVSFLRQINDIAL
jgi:hypothetical protein